MPSTPGHPCGRNFFQLIPDLRASASLGPCNLRNSLESSVPGYPGRGPSGSDPGQASDLALAPVPPQASAPVLGRHAAGVPGAAPAQGLASALAPKDASPVASEVGGPLGRPSSDHGSPACSTGPRARNGPGCRHSRSSARKASSPSRSCCQSHRNVGNWTSRRSPEELEAGGFDSRLKTRLLPWHRRRSYEPDAPARGVPQRPRWRVGLVCARMRNFLAGVITPAVRVKENRTALGTRIGSTPNASQNSRCIVRTLPKFISINSLKSRRTKSTNAFIGRWFSVNVCNEQAGRVSCKTACNVGW